MKLFRDTGLLFASYLKSTLRNPVWVIISLFQPICWLLLFAPLLDNVAKAPGFPSGGALNVFTPGVLIMLGMFGSLFVGFGLIADLREGVVERLRVTPVSRMAPLLARALRDVLMLLVQCVILLIVAWMMGLNANFGGILLTLALMILMGLVLATFSYGLALALKSEDALAPALNFFTGPLLLLSGITLPLTLAPDWIRNIAIFNPFAHAVDAARALFNGNTGDTSVWIGFTVILVLAVLSISWAARSFQKATA
jgi:ABC-2 type transport system permease protein